MKSSDMVEQANYWPNYCKPTATASVVAVTGSPCLYRFTLTVTRGHCDLNGTFNFRLADGFSNISNITPSGADVDYDATTDTGVWDFGTLTAQSATVSFTLQYTGAAGVTIFQAASVTYNCGCGGNRTVNARITNLQTTTQCPETPSLIECCEARCDDDYDEFSFESCDQDAIEMTADVAVVPRGRRVSVHLNLPEVCTTKDINVGVFLTEVINGVEVDYAHKVIRRTATDPDADAGDGECTDDRDCRCVDFMIDDADTDTSCTSRTFRVRTQAHYVESTGTNDAATSQQCACTGSCPDD